MNGIRVRPLVTTITARSRACGNTITAQLSESADSAARVQADMFWRVGATAKVYARVADKRGCLSFVEMKKPRGGGASLLYLDTVSLM